MTVIPTSAVLAPLVLTGYMTAAEADGCRHALLDQVIPEMPSDFAALIDTTLARLRAMDQGESET